MEKSTTQNGNAFAKYVTTYNENDALLGVRNYSEYFLKHIVHSY